MFIAALRNAALHPPAFRRDFGISQSEVSPTLTYILIVRERSAHYLVLKALLTFSPAQASLSASLRAFPCCLCRVFL
jgi:hypothetical protein